MGEAIIRNAPKLLSVGGELITKIKDGLKEGFNKIITVGEDLVKGLWEGIKSMGSWIKDKIKGFANSIIDGFKDFFGIASPSKVMRDQIGKNLGLGIAEGIDDTIDDVESAMNNLSASVEASVNPTINPTANSNPLYVNIDRFYNNRQTDIQQLAEELEFYRKNRALAKGGV